MRQLVLSAFVFLLLISCNDSAPKKLEDAFILSIQKNDFKLLKKFLPNVAYYRSLGDKMSFFFTSAIILRVMSSIFFLKPGF